MKLWDSFFKINGVFFRTLPRTSFKWKIFDIMMLNKSFFKSLKEFMVCYYGLIVVLLAWLLNWMYTK